jgi:starch phosphorylase
MSTLETTAAPPPDTGFDALRELALDLRSTWYHGADELWMQLDPELWSLTHNAWVVLQTVSRRKLHAVLAQPDYRRRLEALLERRRQYLAAPTWFQQNHPHAPLSRVAYFSLEYALSEALPIYSGGLGNVASDQLKAANDLGVPVVGHRRAAPSRRAAVGSEDLAAGLAGAGGAGHAVSAR